MSVVDVDDRALARRGRRRGSADGARFAGAWAAGHDGAAAVARGVRRARSRDAACSAAAAVDGRVPTIVDLVPAADWDEREAHDLHGLGFDGHEPLRALVAHPQDPRAWMTPVTGDGVHEVAVGPIHAGVIESGHFRFHVVGERILALDARLFYKHRGLERAAEGAHVPARAWPTPSARARRARSPTPWPTRTRSRRRSGCGPIASCAARARCCSSSSASTTISTTSARCARASASRPARWRSPRSRIARSGSTTRLAGHRFLFGTVAVGAGAFAADQRAADAARGTLRELRADAAAAWRELEFAGSVQARLDGVGRARRGGRAAPRRVGPAARARRRAQRRPRATARGSAYDGFAPAAPRRRPATSRRAWSCGRTELEATCDAARRAAGRPGRRPGRRRAAQAPRPLGVGARREPARRDALRGRARGRPRSRALRLRTGSYANWPALAHAAVGNLLPDFPLINKSFELCYACVDR